MLTDCNISGSIIVGIKHPDTKHIISVTKKVSIIRDKLCSVAHDMANINAEPTSKSIGIVNIKPTIPSIESVNPKMDIINTAGTATINMAQKPDKSIDIYNESPCKKHPVPLRESLFDASGGVTLRNE